MVDSNRAVTAFSVLCIAIVVFFHFLLVDRNALNIPANDEIADVLKFLAQGAQATSLDDFFSALFTQHADHMTSSSRIVYWLLYSIQGEISFRAIAFFAPVAIVVTVVMLCCQTELRHRQIGWLLIAVALLSPRSWSLPAWPMAAMEYYFVHLYGLLALLLLSKNNGWFAMLASLAAFLATFSYVTGLFVWPVGAVMALLSWRSGRGSVSAILVWVVSAVLTLVLFFSRYSPLSSSSTDLVGFALDNFFYLVQFSITLLGSSLSLGNAFLAQAFGYLIALYLVSALYAGLVRGLQPIHFYILYCLLGIGIIALGRAPASLDENFGAVGLDLALVPRYAFSSMSLLAGLICLEFTRHGIVSLSTVRVAAVAATLGLCASNYLLFPEKMAAHRDWRVEQFEKRGLTPLFYSREKVYAELHQYEALGIYTIPTEVSELR